ncbi:MAG: hypothetical protein K0R30_459 [Ornithinibacter sp.]|jgi:hypothetical protein|nr:hypothetical protein [Ornithinibacter sp.]
MRRFFTITVTAVIALFLFNPMASGGSPHFVDVSAERSGDSLIVSGKEAGLGNETQVHIVVTADAACINPGSKHPKAANKESFSAEGDFPVQNGKAEFELILTADLQPDCSPPMTVVWTNVTVTDEEHGVTKSIPGTF